jgi:hypothetical protein
LRFGLDPRAFDAASDPAALAPNTVLLWNDMIEAFADFRGYLALDERDGAATPAQMQNAMRSWRIAFAEKVLNRT